MTAKLALNLGARWRLKKLDRKHRNDADTRVRIRVILKVAAGLSCNAAAREVGCVPSTAVRTVARFAREGEASLLDHRGENGTRKVDDDIVGRLRQILIGQPEDHGFERPTWTLEILKAVIAQVIGVTLSVTHVWRLAKRIGARWGRPRPIVACPWKARRRRKRIAELRRLADSASDRDVVVFVDEVDIHLNPKLGPDWMLPGVQRLVLTPGKNEKRYLAGAFEPLHNRLIYVEGTGKASWLFMNLLRALNEAYDSASTIHLILDNYIIHKSRVTQAWLAQYGARIRLHFLPPYCPNENRIERLWLDLHANVTRNHRQPTMSRLMDRVHAHLAKLFHIERRLLLAA